MILNDKQIKDLCINQNMIEPFVDRSVKEIDGKKVISYGVSSYGVDLRLKPKVKLFTNAFNGIVDPKNFDEKCLIDLEPNEGEDFIILPPHSFILAETVEYFKMPENVFGLVQGKSTIARCGIGTLVTPLEPGWTGVLVLEFHNTTPNPVKMYVNEGCCQLVLFQGERPEVAYSDRAGKYQNQTGITLAKV